MEAVNKTVIFNGAPDNVGITLDNSTTLADLEKEKRFKLQHFEINIIFGIP